MITWQNNQLGNILIVDDSRTNLNFLLSILENVGYSVITANNGTNALSVAFSRNPNLILLDVDMPDIDGYEVCRLLKESEVTRSIPVIFISAMDDVRDKIRGFECGGVDYITKPFLLEEVMGRVNTHLTLYRLQKEIEITGHHDWKDAFNTVNKAVLLTDAQGYIMDCNQAALDMLGCSAAKPPQGFIGHFLFKETIKASEMISLHGEIQFPRLEGWYDISTYPLNQDGRRQGTVFVIENITDKKQAEGMMISSQRRADLEAFSASLAYEFKSPLQAITRASESLMEHLKQGPLQNEDAHASLKAINNSGRRLNDIMLSLSNGAHRPSNGNEPQNFNDIILDTLHLIEYQLNVWANVQLSIQMGNDLPVLTCDRLKISQVLINLLMNARDAMPSGGAIEVSTAYDPSAEVITLRVADSGTGIADDIRGKIFEQFFTTKPRGQGAGLGLYIVNSAVKAHGGRIHLNSLPGKGTTFTLLFPVRHHESQEDQSGVSV